MTSTAPSRNAVRPLKAIITKDADGVENGWILPIWNASEPGGEEERPEQVYLTTVDPGHSKGPHLHLRRVGRFCCVRGSVKIVTREAGRYVEYKSGSGQFSVIRVPAGVPAMIVNVGVIAALVLNMPSPSWKPDDQDEHEVTDWDWELS